MSQRMRVLALRTLTRTMQCEHYAALAEPNLGYTIH